MSAVVTGRPGRALFVCRIESHHDLVQVRYLGNVIENRGQRGPMELRIEGRQYQRHRPRLAKLHQLGLEFLQGPMMQLMQSCDDTVLMEVTHVIQIPAAMKAEPRSTRERQVRLRSPSEPHSDARWSRLLEG